MKKVNESSEALMRIPVGIVSGIVIGLWRVLVVFLALVNFVITLVSSKRSKDIADFSETWNTQMYVFMKYMLFVSNERPFPFEKMTKSISKFEK
ncbi:DUF4389 domain-containing protein [Candidatus Gracilibacteria bacterium]|nr:DUF4389 domain-containing protein [Candidatus Gracilibacteria bacterium]